MSRDASGSSDPHHLCEFFTRPFQLSSHPAMIGCFPGEGESSTPPFSSVSRREAHRVARPTRCWLAAGCEGHGNSEFPSPRLMPWEGLWYHRYWSLGTFCHGSTWEYQKSKSMYHLMRFCVRENLCVCSYIECMACLAIVSISGVYHRNIIRIIVQPTHTPPSFACPPRPASLFVCRICLV